ncbi:MAG: DUF3102 domain-containing protein [Alphaproteobacteria bacterium]|nr:DUF3102 domain-containing protein [Alphaproteobacteria bacterium]
MNQIVVPIPVTEAEFAKTINERYGRLRAAARRTLDEALELGALLTAAKQFIGHGRFGTWCKASLPFGVRQAQTFMRLHEWRDTIPELRKSELGSDLTIASARAALRRINGIDSRRRAEQAMPMSVGPRYEDPQTDVEVVARQSLADFTDEEIAAEYGRRREVKGFRAPKELKDWYLRLLEMAEDEQGPLANYVRTTDFRRRPNNPRLSTA